MRAAAGASLQNADSSSTLTEDQLPLYTKSGALLGYMIPLEMNGACNEYVITIAVDDIYQILTIAEGALDAETVLILKSKGGVAQSMPIS